MIKLLSKYIVKIREQGDDETLERTDAENQGLSNRSFMFIYFSIFHSGLPWWLEMCWGFLGSSAGDKSACNAGDMGLIPGSGRSTRERTSSPLECSWASPVAQLVKNLPAMWET